jgi:phage tail-like protein
MALPDDNTRQLLMACNFRVVVAQRTIGFMDVTGLSRQHQTLTYRHGLSFCEGERIVKFHEDKFVSITLKKGTVIPEAAFLYTWIETKIEVPMTVSLCNGRGLPVINWKMARVLPVKLTPPNFDASSSAVCIDTFEVMAAGITVDVVV